MEQPFYYYANKKSEQDNLYTKYYRKGRSDMKTKKNVEIYDLKNQNRNLNNAINKMTPYMMKEVVQTPNKDVITSKDIFFSKKKTMETIMNKSHMFGKDVKNLNPKESLTTAFKNISSRDMKIYWEDKKKKQRYNYVIRQNPNYSPKEFFVRKIK